MLLRSIKKQDGIQYTPRSSQERVKQTDRQKRKNKMDKCTDKIFISLILCESLTVIKDQQAFYAH